MKNIANVPMPSKLGVVAHGICRMPLPFARVVCPVMIVIFVKYIE